MNFGGQGLYSKECLCSYVIYVLKPTLSVALIGERSSEKVL